MCGGGGVLSILEKGGLGFACTPGVLGGGMQARGVEYSEGDPLDDIV